MKRIDTSNKTKEELLVNLKELRGQLAQFSFDLAEKKLKDTTQLGRVKRDIARILTALSSKSF